jgi:dipeptidyl aminopeptidase/acylaminoacyl peptidase
LVGDTWQQCPENLEEIEVVGCGDNPGEIVVVGERKDGKPRPLEVMDAASGKVLNVLLEDAAYDFDGWLYRDPVSHRILGAMGSKIGPYSVWFNEPYRNLQKALEKLFPGQGQIVRIIGTDATGKMVLLSNFSDRQPPIYSWANLEKHQAGMFRSSMPWIDPQRMQPMVTMKFKTRDGKQFDAFVTLPKGTTKQNPAPLVVLPHDGPWARTTWGYDPEVQFLASRGYAVLQPNYRGSPGCTWMYPTEDEWAYRKMHEDVTDATKALLASGYVDRHRVAIMGHGFGGYLALCGVAFEPSLYRCAVAVSANYDWGKLIEDQQYNQYSNPFYARMLAKLGDPKKEVEKFDAMSPLKHANDIRVPVLVSYGEYDQTVEIAMAKDLVSTLRHKGLDADSIRFANEGSGVHYVDHKVELYERVEAFLAKNLGPEAQ